MELLFTGERVEEGWKLKDKRGVFVGGSFCTPPHKLANLNIPYNTYDCQVYISYSDMNKIRQYFKHRILPIFHSLVPWHL